MHRQADFPQAELICAFFKSSSYSPMSPKFFSQSASLSCMVATQHRRLKLLLLRRLRVGAGLLLFQSMVDVPRAGSCRPLRGALSGGLQHTTGVWRRKQPMPSQCFAFSVKHKRAEKPTLGKRGPSSCARPPRLFMPFPSHAAAFMSSSASETQGPSFQGHAPRGRLPKVYVEFLIFLEDKR